MFMQADASTEPDKLVCKLVSILGQTVDFFAASSYGAATVASGDVSVNMAAAKIDVSGRHVLVVSRQRTRHHWGSACPSCQRQSAQQALVRRIPIHCLELLHVRLATRRWFCIIWFC